MKVFKLQGDSVLPTVKFKGDAGMDFYAYNNWIIKSHASEIISTGIGVIVPEGYVGLLKPKGSSNHLIGAGVVDSNYRGEILFKIFNPYKMPISIMHGQPVGQMIVLKCLDLEIEEVRARHVDHTDREDTGGIVNQYIPPVIPDSRIRIDKWD